MGKTIEERLDALQACTISDASVRLKEGIGCFAGMVTVNYKKFIIADWNTAIKAMKAIVSVDLDTTHGAHYCHGCHSDIPYHSERHLPATCRIAALQAIIAKMEGTDA